MENAMLQHETYPTEVLKTLSEFQKEGFLCDVVINIGDITFKAHRAVLSCFSSYFRRIFQNDAVNDDIATIQISDVPVNTIHEVFNLAYNRKIEITNENVQELLVASKFFDIVSLQETCELFAGELVDIDNCIDVFSFSKKHDFKYLKKQALEVVPDDAECLQNLQIDPNQLLEIFEEDSITLKIDGLPLSKEEREIILLKSILRHISEKPEYKSSFPDYMQRMRIPNISRTNLMETLEAFPELLENEIVCHLLRLATLVRSGRFDPEVPPFWTTDNNHGYWKLTNTNLYSKDTHLGPPIYSFDDSGIISPNVAIRVLILYFCPWISVYVLGGMEIGYSDGRVFSYGLKKHSAIAKKRFKIELEEREWITKAEVFSGWLIDNLILTTNKGRVFGPFGDNRRGGNNINRAEKGPYDHLHSFIGNVVFEKGHDCIRQIGFTWANYKTQPSLKEN